MYVFRSKIFKMLKFTRNGTCQYISIGFEGSKEILTIFVNIYSNSCLTTIAILVRKGFLTLCFFYITHHKHPLAIPSQYTDGNEKYLYGKCA
jgi:hypothetical protein